MIEFFSIYNSFGCEIAADRKTGNLCSIRSDTKEFSKIIAIMASSKPQFIILCTIEDLNIPLNVVPYSFQSSIFPLYIENKNLDGFVAFKYPIENRFLCSGPGKNKDITLVTANADIRNAWEDFRLEKIPLNEVDVSVLNISEKIEFLFNHDDLSNSVISLIKEPPSISVSNVLKGLLILLDINDLDKISEKLLSSPEISKNFSEHFPDDIWATFALPNLKKWVQHRKNLVETDHQEKIFNNEFKNNQKIVENKYCLSELNDFLANAGSSGSYVSLGHAINAAARRSIKPSKSSCIIATARNEGLYLIEWIAYHRKIGIEAFFLYTNDNDDGSDNLYSALADAGVINWVKSDISSGGSAQYKAYGHALGIVPDILDYAWALVIDLDEFFVFNKDDFSSINEFLNQDKLSLADSISVNWTAANIDGNRFWNETPITRRFTVTADQPHDTIKSIFRPGNFIHSSPHAPRTDKRLNPIFHNPNGELYKYGKTAKERGVDIREWVAISDEPDTSVASINHYFYKSAEEFLWKASRNRGDLPKEDNISKNQKLLPFFKAFLEQYEYKPLITDNRLHDCAIELEKEMEYLRNLPGVMEAELCVREAFQKRMPDILDFYKNTLPICNDPSTRQLIDLATHNTDENIDTIINNQQEFNSIIHIQPTGGIGNRMIQLMAAISVQNKIPNAVLSNVSMPEWHIQIPSLMQDDLNIGVNNKTIRIGRSSQDLKINVLADQFRSHAWKAIIIDGYAQHINNFLPYNDYETYFQPSEEINRTVNGFDETYLVCSIRGSEILDGCHRDYVLIPSDFYIDLVKNTGLKPIFYGQIEDNPYCLDLRQKLPNALFIKGKDPIYDFEVLRRSKNIVPSISTFAWLAAFLSKNSKIFLPCLGLFNPRQIPSHNFLPLNDSRYEFYWFPISYSENIKYENKFWQAQRNLEGRWKHVPNEFFQNINKNVPSITRRIGEYLKWFNEDFYLEAHPGVKKGVEDGIFSTGLQHYWDHGFEGSAIAFAFSPQFYCRTYPDAACEVSRGEYLDFQHHFVEIGHLRGYKPTEE